MTNNSLVLLRSLAIPKGLQTGPFGSQLKAEEYKEDGVPVIMPKDIYNGSIIVKGIARVSEEKAKKLTRHRLIEGDILFPRRGDLGRIAVVKEGNEGWLCGSGCLRARLNRNVNVSYIHQYIQLPSVRKWLESKALGQTMLNLNTEIVGKLPIFIVPLTEQVSIAKMLSTWDQAIEKTEQLIAAKEQKYIWLLGIFISNLKYHRNNIRNFATEISKRNNDIEVNRVLSVTNNRGFILPTDHFERCVASSDLSNYKIVMRGQYAYNPSRINVGSIARLDTWDTGVLSPMYVVFEINEQKVNSDYFLHWLESHEAKQRISKSAQGSVRETVSFSDFAAISIPLPPLNRQKAIAAILNTICQEIELLKKQLEAYRRQKRGIMQKLLTGQWRLRLYEGD